MENPASIIATPSFSVIVPTCHRPDTLRQCLRQLAPGNQSLRADEYEVIVTDDGVKESAEQLINTEFPWACWIAGPGRGPAANRNFGASQARGHWLVFIDDDCIPSSHWLQGYASAIRPGANVYEGQTTCESGIRSPLEHAPVNLHGGCLWSCNMMVTRELFIGVGEFDTRFPYPHMEDAEFKKRVQTRAEIIFVGHARVDHPPRRLSPGSTLARHQECRVYFDQIHHRKTSLLNLLIDIARSRLQAIRRHRFSRDSVLALASLVAELCTVTVMMPSWLRKYALEAKAPTR